ncbi:unnamed protein product [Amoebophrya sp. A25]|nr:unnamed protein product [Amoebophrya sp. A25]|eukprot:GSA25T00021675001.1
MMRVPCLTQRRSSSSSNKGQNNKDASRPVHLDGAHNNTRGHHRDPRDYYVAGSHVDETYNAVQAVHQHQVAERRPSQKDYYLPHPQYGKQSGCGYEAHRQPSHDISTTTHSDSSSAEETDEHHLVTTKIMPDPVPTLAPKSKKMALGSITFSAEQGIPLGVMRKDNSFFLRVEKCDPVFASYLNYEIEKMHQFKCPPDAEDKAEYWPENALHNYCQRPNPALKAEMDRVYRFWHDQRSQIGQLHDRLADLKQRRAARYGKD